MTRRISAARPTPEKGWSCGTYGILAPPIYAYDRIGNFDTTSIWLLNTSQQLLQKRSKYNYAAGNNRLNNIQDITGTPVIDRVTGYDAAGRQLTDTQRKVTATNYRPSNLAWGHMVTSTTTSNALSYIYAPGGQRIYKGNTLNPDDTPISKEYYLHNVRGQELAVLNLMTSTAVVTSWYVQGREREARFPDERYSGGVSGKPGKGGGTQLFEEAATTTDVFEVKYPARLYLVTASDSLHPLGYLLQNEAESQKPHLRPVQEVVVTHPRQRLYCTDTLGHQARMVTLQDVLTMRQAGEPFLLEGYSTDCIAERPTALFMPPPTQINPRYYIYDHLGNTRIVYGTNVPSTCAGATLYTLEVTG